MGGRSVNITITRQKLRRKEMTGQWKEELRERAGKEKKKKKKKSINYTDPEDLYI